MIVKMAKVYIITEAAQRGPALDALADLSVVHLAPVDPASAAASETTLAAIDNLNRAMQVLSQIEPAGPAPEIPALHAAAEVLRIERESAEGNSRLTALHRQIQQLGIWGDTRLGQFEQLRDSGIRVSFVSVPVDQFAEIRADCTEVVAELPGKRVMVAVAQREGEALLPESADEVPLPQRDRPSLRAEAADIDRALQAGARRLAQLAHLVGDMRREHAKFQQQACFTVAECGGLTTDDLFAVQGWVPEDRAKSLSSNLSAAGVDAGVRVLPPADDETPPTLIRYPKWSLPIKGLFDMLGTLPGYREIDVGGFFMIALPIFAAMLIGDAGYGLLFILVPALTYRKAVAAAGKPGVHLLMVMGMTTIVWGLLTGVFFGICPRDFIGAGGFWVPIGRALGAFHVVSGSLEQQGYTIMKISFVIAAIHLSLAQLRQALALAPRLDALSKVGWATFLWGTFLVIWYLFFDSQAGNPPHRLTSWLLVIGAALTIAPASPDGNPLKMIGLGLAKFPLSALGAFSDSISYMRLMAVGLASTIVGQTFNSLGAQAAGEGTWFLGAFVVLFGHSLNIAMCMIAILAHGVRLNMLEFSNNVGVQWAGYAYQPFAAQSTKE